MEKDQPRREFLTAAGVAVAAGTVGYAQTAEAQPGAAPASGQPAGEPVKIIAVCCSPRKGRTTYTALATALAAARETGSGVDTELIELADRRISGCVACGTCKNGLQS